jgi:hypothetical protein
VVRHRFDANPNPDLDWHQYWNFGSGFKFGIKTMPIHNTARIPFKLLGLVTRISIRPEELLTRNTAFYFLFLFFWRDLVC